MLRDSTNVKHMMVGMRLTPGETQKIARTDQDHVARQIILKHAKWITFDSMVNRRSLNFIDPCIGLQGLIIPAIRYTPEDLTFLPKHSDLRTLDIAVKATRDNYSVCCVSIAKLTKLKNLSITATTDLCNVSGLPVTLRSLKINITGCALPHLATLTSLAELKLSISSDFESRAQIDLTPIASLSLLERLSLQVIGYEEACTLPRLSTRLQQLKLSGIIWGRRGAQNDRDGIEIGHITDLSALKSVTLSIRQDPAADAQILSKCSSLRYVQLNVASVKDIGELSESPTLRTLELLRCRNLEGIAQFNNCRSLRELKIIGGGGRLLNLTPLAENVTIRALFIKFYSSFEEFETITGCHTLTHLCLAGCKGADVSILTNCARLRHVLIAGCTDVTGVDELRRHGTRVILDQKWQPQLWSRAGNLFPRHFI